MKITSKGQVTIPLDIRERLGLLPHTEVDFVVDGKGARIIPRPAGQSARGTQVIGRLRGSGTIKMSTDQIMALTRKP